MVLLVLLLIPVVVSLGFYFFGRVTLKEFLLQLAIQVVVAGISAGIIYWGNTSDVEIWNGKITLKKQERVSCEHSYRCHPHSCNCDKHGCDTCWDTCYEHLYDYDWNLYTSNREGISIARVDRQGTTEPPRWTKAEIGDPTSQQHGYTSYIKAAPGTLFRNNGNYDGVAVPAYPINVFDYHYLNHLVLFGVSLNDAKLWNWDLMNLNADVGRRKQVNVILVVGQNQPPEWYYAIEHAWLGGKKNDLIAVASVDNEGKFSWVNVMGWTQTETVKVKLRNALMDVGRMDREKVIQQLRTAVEFYDRKPMKEFEYLKASITPTTTQWIVSLIFGLAVSIGVGVFLHKEDLFGEEYNQRYSARRAWK